MSRTLILADGSIAGLVALAAEGDRNARDADQALVWAADLTSHLDPTEVEACRKAVSVQAGIYGFEAVAHPMLIASSRASDQSAALLRVAHEAARLGCRRVVWSVQYPYIGSEPDLDIIASTVDRGLLVSRLASLDIWDQSERTIPEVRIETPYVDLNDDQLAELALDLSVSIASVWWLNAQTPGAMHARTRWRSLLQDVGLLAASRSVS